MDLHSTRPRLNSCRRLRTGTGRTVVRAVSGGVDGHRPRKGQEQCRISHPYPSGAQQRLDGAALVHCAVALRHLLERQGQVEDLSGVNLAVQHKVDQLWQKAAHRCRAAVEVDVREEQFLPLELDAVRDADVGDVPAFARRADRLLHRLLGADALQHRISTDSVGQILDASHALVAALGHDVGRAELAGELLPRLVTAHRDDSFGAHLLGGEHTEEADRPVSDDGDRHAGFYIRRLGGEPACAEDVGGRQQARNHVLRGDSGRRHEGAVRERDAQHGRLRAADELGVLAGRLVARSANGTGVIGGEERTDNELAALDRGDLTADFLDDAAVLVPHRARLRCRVEAAVGPQVGPAYARGRHPDDRIRRLDDPRVVALLETHIARGVKNGSSHGLSPFSHFRYCSSLTCSSQSTFLPSTASWMAMWLIPVAGEAPCQCFTPGGMRTTSPGWISSTGPPQRCTSPLPAVTIRIWPTGCVCQAERAPGSNVTRPPDVLDGAFAANSGSTRTEPVKNCASPLLDGWEPARVMVIVSSARTGAEARAKSDAAVAMSSFISVLKSELVPNTLPAKTPPP